MSGEGGQPRGLGRARTGQPHLEGLHRNLGALVLELLGLQSRTRLLAEEQALTSLKWFFPESSHAWGLRSN